MNENEKWYVYTPETVGGNLFYEVPTGVYWTQGKNYIRAGADTLIYYYEHVREGWTDVIVRRPGNTSMNITMVASTRRLEFQKHPTYNYYTNKNVNEN